MVWNAVVLLGSPRNKVLPGMSSLALLERRLGSGATGGTTPAADI